MDDSHNIICFQGCWTYSLRYYSALFEKEEAQSGSEGLREVCSLTSLHKIASDWLFRTVIWIICIFSLYSNSFPNKVYNFW